MNAKLPTSDEHVEYEACPERRLMIAVLLTAIRDASGMYIAGSRVQREHTQMRALNWIRNGGEDFHEVCALAGLEPREVRKKALRFIYDPNRPAHRMPSIQFMS